jgi:hypothetical protein
LGDRGIKQSTFSVLGSERQRSCLLQSPGRRAQFSEVGAGTSGLLELAGQILIWTHRRRDPMGEPSATGDEFSSTRV